MRHNSRRPDHRASRRSSRIAAQAAQQTLTLPRAEPDTVLPGDVHCQEVAGPPVLGETEIAWRVAQLPGQDHEFGCRQPRRPPSVELILETLDSTLLVGPYPALHTARRFPEHGGDATTIHSAHHHQHAVRLVDEARARGR